MSDGEIRRNFQRIEQSQNALSQRLTDVAKDMVPAALWSAEHRAVIAQFERHEREADEAQARLDRQMQLFRDTCDKASAELRAELRKSVTELRAERDKRSEFTWTRVLGVLGITVTLVIALITTIAASKGIK